MWDENDITNDLNSVVINLKPQFYFISDDSQSATTRPRGFSAAIASSAVSNNSPLQIRNKSLSFDLGLSLPTNNSKKLNTDVNDIHSEEGFSINEQIFMDEQLVEVYRKAKTLRDTMHADETDLSDEFMDVFNVVEDIVDIRDAIRNKEWIKVRSIFIKLENEVKDSIYSSIIEELSLNRIPIFIFAVINASINAIKAGPNYGPIGLPDYKGISLDILEEAMKMYEDTPIDVQHRLEVLNQTLISLHALRKAQKQGNWKEISVCLDRLHQELTSSKISDIILNEVSRANIEKENHECITSLKNALINEEIFCKDSLLDTEQISVKDLTAAIGKISQMPEDSRGIILKPLHLLADCVLKARKAASQKNWYVLENVLPVLKENIDNFQNEIDGKDRLSLHRKTLAFRSSNLHRGTMMVKDRGSNGKMSITDVGNTGAAGMLIRSSTWDEYAEVNQSIKREIKAIEHHFSIKELEKSLPEKMSQFGIIASEENGIELQNIQTQDLQECLDHAGNLESSNLSLPTSLKALRKIGILIVNLRSAVLASKWDEINSLLEETLQLEMSHMPEYNRLEVQLVRREVENRWIIQNLTSAILSGALQSEGDNWCVSTQHLPSFIQTVRSLQPRSEEANFLCYTGEKILALRELLQPPKSGNFASVVPWQRVISLAKQIELEISQGYVHSMLSPEISLCLQIAHDRQVCERLEQAIVSGVIDGEPEKLNFYSISTNVLADMCKAIPLSSLKSIYSQVLYEVAKHIYELRETCCTCSNSRVRVSNRIWLKLIPLKLSVLFSSILNQFY